MPFGEVSKVEQRELMIRKYLTGMYNKAELAREFGVTRAVIYTWIGRYEEFGMEGLVDRPPVPKTSPHRTDPEVAARLIDEKRRHPNWGPGILIPHLRETEPSISWPAVSTGGSILKAAGLVKTRRRSKTIPTWSIESLEIDVAQECMTADHKGQFLLKNGRYCYPLTLANPHSRYIYAVESLSSTSYREARPVFERVFQEHGLPRWILTDNGGPFCCASALRGLTRLSAWWIKLGIQPVRINPGSPWQNGIHERMHRTLKQETTRPPETTHEDQQRRFDAFRVEYNELRPHSALGKRPPSSAYRHFERPYEGSLESVEYPGHYETRTVRSKGSIRWKGEELFLSEALSGERVALVEIDDGIWAILFAEVELARFNERTRDFK